MRQSVHYWGWPSSLHQPLCANQHGDRNWLRDEEKASPDKIENRMAYLHGA